MARLIYSALVPADNSITTDNGESILDTADLAVAYHVWNSSSEAMKLDIVPNNGLTVKIEVTNAEVSKHTGTVLAVGVRNNSLIIDAGAAVHLTVTALVPVSTDADNTVTFTVGGIHTDVGLVGNTTYIARIVSTDAGFNSAI